MGTKLNPQTYNKCNKSSKEIPPIIIIRSKSGILSTTNMIVRLGYLRKGTLKDWR
jgi:hypothetical protein